MSRLITNAASSSETRIRGRRCTLPAISMRASWPFESLSRWSASCFKKLCSGTLPDGGCVTQLLRATICGMLNRDYEGQNCSIARALEVVGERWTLLIIRDVLLGLRRFDQLQESLGIARNVLTDRLNRLVDEGVLERVLYSERPERYEYQLTKEGPAQNIGIAAFRRGGANSQRESPPRPLRGTANKPPVAAAPVRRGTKALRAGGMEVGAGPGATGSAPRRRSVRAKKR